MGKTCLRLVTSSCLCLDKHLHLYHNSIVGLKVEPGVKIVVEIATFGCHFPAAGTLVDQHVQTELGVIMLVEFTSSYLLIFTKCTVR